MGGACGTYAGKERFMQNFGGETRGNETAWKNVGVDGRIIFETGLQEVG
jgi:hypothetical protein